MPNFLSRWFGKAKTDVAGISDSARQMTSGMATGRNPPGRGTEELIEAYRQIPMLRGIVQRIAENFAAVPWTVTVVKGKGGKAVRAKGLERMPPEMRAKAVAELVAKGQAEQLDDDPILDFLDHGNDCLDGFTCRQVMQTYLELKGEAIAWLERNPLGMPIAYWPLSPAWVTNVPAPGQQEFEISIGGQVRRVPRRDVLAIVDPDPENPYLRGTGIGESLADELDTSEYVSAFIKSFFFNNATPSVLFAFPREEGVAGDAVKKLELEIEQKHRGAQRGHRFHVLNAAPQVTQFGQSFKDMALVDLQKYLRDVCRETWGIPPEIMGLIENSNRATIDAAGFIFSLWILVPRCRRWSNALQRQLAPQFDERKIIGYVSPVQEDRAFELQVATANPATRTRNEWRRLQGLEDRGPADDVYLQSAIMVETPAPVPPGTKSAGRIVTKDEDAPTVKIDPILRALDPKRLTEETRPLWEEELEQWGQEALNDLGVDVAFDLRNPLVDGHLRDFSGTRITQINTTTRDAIRGQLVEGFEAGESMKDLAARIRGVFDDCDKRRSLLIARTETMRSSNFAEHEAQVLSGVVESREYIATPDDRVREMHIALNGVVVGLNEPFEYADGTTFMTPGDSGDPGQDCNCRCTTAASFDGKAHAPEQQKALWKAFDRKLSAWERAATSAFRRGFRAQRDDVLAALEAATR